MTNMFSVVQQKTFFKHIKFNKRIKKKKYFPTVNNEKIIRPIIYNSHG